MENEADVAEITRDVEPNYLDPNFILQNLAICSTEKLYDQPPFTIRAKQRLAEIVALQTVYYTMLCLKAFIGCDMPPSIVIVGTGTIGNAIIELLTSCGCQPYISIYSRSDVAAKQWRERGYKSHHNIQRLLRGQNCDIIIFAFNLQSFPSVCRQIIDVITTQTACINCIFGLNRKRIFRVLRINTVFRTFVEATRISRKLERELKGLMDDARAQITVSDVKTAVSDFFQQGGVLSNLSESNAKKPPLPSEIAGKTSIAVVEEEDSDVDDDDSVEERTMSVAEEACHLISSRSDNTIVHIITLLESFNALRGMPFPLARREAIESVLGDIIDEDREPIPPLNPHIIPPVITEKRPSSRDGSGSPKVSHGKHSFHTPLSRKSTFSNFSQSRTHSMAVMRKERSTKKLSREVSKLPFPVNKSSPLLNLKFPLSEVIVRMHYKVGGLFQRYFSKYILIAEIPPPIKEHPVDSNFTNHPEWPPEPIYFNNILDIYADRRRKNQPLHDEEELVAIYDSDAVAPSKSSRGANLIHELDLEEAEDNADINAIKAPSVVEAEKKERLMREMEEFGFGDDILAGLESGGDTGWNTANVSPSFSPRTLALDPMEKLARGSQLHA